MEHVQKEWPLKIHMIEAEADRPVCGTIAWRGGWQRVFDNLKINLCKNCMRVLKAREGKKQPSDAEAMADRGGL